jgi:glycosyltransferase involved in cell wall biosynthesis
MNICFVCSEYPPNPHGGIGSFTEMMARALVGRGHAVRVVGVYPHEGAYAARECIQGVDVWRLRRHNHRLGWIRSRWELARMIVGWSRTRQIDVIEVPDYQGSAALWPQLQVPLVTRLHGSLVYFAAEMALPIDRKSYWLERASLRRSDFLASVSRYTYERSKELFGLKADAELLYNFVEAAPFISVENRSANQVVFSGTLTPKKGILSLIRAWPGIKQNVGSAELHIFGRDGRTQAGDSMRATALSMLSPAERAGVYFHEHVPRAKLLTALGTARVAVFPSYAESFGLAPVEAMSQGCPTVYTRRPPGPEVIRDHIDGLLVDPDRPDEIVRAVTDLLQNSSLAARLGAAAHRRVRDMFSAEAVIANNEAFYRACIRAFRLSHNREVSPSRRDVASASKP